MANHDDEAIAHPPVSRPMERTTRSSSVKRKGVFRTNPLRILIFLGSFVPAWILVLATPRVPGLTPIVITVSQISIMMAWVILGDQLLRRWRRQDANSGRAGTKRELKIAYWVVYFLGAIGVIALIAMVERVSPIPGRPIGIAGVLIWAIMVHFGTKRFNRYVEHKEQEDLVQRGHP